eukprot:12492456-Alexandrium_andersonii.AAC.1
MMRRRRQPRARAARRSFRGGRARGPLARKTIHAAQTVASDADDRIVCRQATKTDGRREQET